jgi:hypothetical protein
MRKQELVLLDSALVGLSAIYLDLESPFGVFAQEKQASCMFQWCNYPGFFLSAR